jgi:hypothetical protein
MTFALLLFTMSWVTNFIFVHFQRQHVAQGRASQVVTPPPPPLYVGLLDDSERRETQVTQLASEKASRRPNNRKSQDPPTTKAQVTDRVAVVRKMETMLHSLYKFSDMPLLLPLKYPVMTGRSSLRF